MKPVCFYDANIFSKIKHEKLREIVDSSHNLITDDVVKELLCAKDKYTKNTNFNANMELVFNENEGINSKFSMILSHIPVEITEVVEHTENLLNLKVDPLICSFHHLWMPFAVNPSILTNRIRHDNSELTWRMSKGDLSYDDAYLQNAKNRLRLKETKFREKHNSKLDVSIPKIVRAWSKRDKNIRDGNYRITDNRLLVHALDSMLAFGCSVNILTSDYDLIDLQISLVDCLYDQYVINNVIKRKCVLLNLEEDVHKEITINRVDFEKEAEKVVNKIETSEEYLEFTIRFYKREMDQWQEFVKIIPFWMYEFLKEFRGNADCLVLRKSSKYSGVLRYIWHSNWRDDNIKFEVWKAPCFQDSDEIRPGQCKMRCLYEINEINNPESLTSFISPEDI